ncbi:LPS export ABC transporter permease LptF [Cognatilysobacter lacus]|uniref:Lipopolysaccharide export system permease protein LptF n=1 Tax=Cognatilysobacter lacus TaxID=1643323 RepID=A0A5D8Z8J7_9GAMM|nr:LPS export ABC transporter permease LptF [Lysobacter lacus]TZF91255.1 LPS export ABC transporter permease LptF [Lysobacter lacus]
MLKFDRYLLSEFVQATLATTLVLLMVAFGAVFADVLRDIAEGRFPADMLLPQLGLLFLNWLPIILPLALMLGLMLAVGRLYRDSEMPVLASVGIGPGRLLRPVLGLALPVIAVIAMCSLWLAPWAERVSKEMVNAATRNLLVAGLEPGRFTPIANGGVVFVSRMSTDGTRFERVFIYRQKKDRLDVTTAKGGHLEADADGHRFLVLDDGFEVEGPRQGAARDYRLMRYRSNQAEMPAPKGRYDPDDPRLLSTLRLLTDARPSAKAELHSRIAPPFLALAFALLAVPLARSSPREGRLGRIAMGFLIYLVATMLSLYSIKLITNGKIPTALGQWWLVLPLLALGAWLYFTDGRIRAPRLRGASR